MEETQKLVTALIQRKIIIGPDHFVLGDGFGNPGLHTSLFIVADSFYEATDLVEDMVLRITAQLLGLPVDLIVTPDDQSLPTARSLARVLAQDRAIAPPPVLSLDPVFSSDIPKLASHSGLVLIHDDVVNRGRQIQAVLELLRAHPRLAPLGISSLFLRVEETRLYDLPIFPALERILVAVPEEHCSFCRAGRPLNQEYGKGRLLERLRQEQREKQS